MSRQHPTSEAEEPFEGFSLHAILVPNVPIDELLAELSEAAWRVCIVLLRRSAAPGKNTSENQ